MSSAPLDSRRNRLAWRLANLALRIGTREYRERLEGITRRGLGAAPRDDATELRARIAELETTNFALSEDSALVANENAELRAALREWAEATRAAEWFELDQTNAYGDDHIDAEDRVEAARRALLALAATEGRREP